MSNLQKHQGKIFTKDNLPDLLEYLADYMREYPECKEGFGLESMSRFHDWSSSRVGKIGHIIHDLSIGSEFKYRPAPLTKTMYNLHTGEAVDVPVEVAETLGVVNFRFLDSEDSKYAKLIYEK